MKIKIENEKAGTVATVDTKSKIVRDLLLELSINSETVIVARNSEILLLTDTLFDGDSLVLLSVISGG